MDVSCERCKTEYEFDEARLTDSGVAVKCASCGHIFLVRKPVAAAPPPAADKPREWKLRKQGQAPITFRELTTLQKWIVEGKVERSDEISLKGETWKQLGDIPELAPFFQVFENAQKAPAQAEPAQGKVIPFTPPAAVPHVAPVASPMAASGGGGVTAGNAPAPAFAPVPPGQGLPSPARPPAVAPQVAAAPSPSASATQAAGAFPVVPPKGGHKPPVVREAPPMAPAMMVTSSPSPFPKLIPIAIGLVALGAAGFYFGRGYLQHSPAKTATEQTAKPAPQTSAPIAKVIVPVRHPEAQKPADTQARDAVKTALAQTPTGSNALKLTHAPPPATPTPTRKEVAQAVAKLPAAVTQAPAQKAEVAKSAPTKAEPSKAAKAAPAATAAKTEPSKAAAEKATAAAEKPAAKEPEHDFDWYLSHADRMRQAEKTKPSIALYQKAIALQPKRAEPVTGLGLAELDLGNIAKAQSAFGKALSLNPSYSVAVMGMAECYRAQGKKEDAVRFYKRFLELVPSGEEAEAARATMARLQQP